MESVVAQLDLYDIQYSYNDFVESIYEAHDGKIWIYNNEDFLRYNGNKFSETNSLSAINSAIKTINDNDGVFYNTSKHKVLYYSNSTKVKTEIIKLTDGTEVDFFYKDDAKQIWLFTKNFKKKERNVYKITKDKTLKLAYNLYEHLKELNIYDNIELKDANGFFYFHLEYGHLTIIDNKGNKVDLQLSDTKDFEDKYECSVFRLDNKNNLWRIYYDTFEIYDSQLKAFKKHPISNKLTIKNLCPRTSGANLGLALIFIDSKKRVWLGFEDSNLFLFDERDNTFINFKTPLIKALGGAAGSIKNIMEDQNGNIWGNKRGGIFKIRKKENLFNSYLINTDNPEHDVYKLNLKYREKVWSYIGKEFLLTETSNPQMDSNGDIYVQDQIYTYKIAAKNNSLEVIPWLHAKSNQYLFFTKNFKLYTTWSHYYKIDENFNIDEVKNNFSLRSLRNLLVKKDNTIWVSGLTYNTNAFITKLNPETLALETPNINIYNSLGLDRTWINTLSEDENGNLWIRTQKALFKMDTKETLERYPDYHFYKTDSIAFTSPDTEFIYATNGLAWVFNEHKIGLLNTETNSLNQYTTKENLNLSKINDVLPINHNSFWYASNTGIGYYNFKSNDHAFFDHTNSLINLLDAKSLTLRPQKGDIITTSTNGIHVFHPDSLLKDHAIRKEINKNVHLEFSEFSVLHGKDKDVTIHNINAYKGEPFTLNYNDKFLTFHFELIHYNYPERHQFITKLEGYDANWSAPNSEKHITYTSLPPGNYTLKVKGSIGNNLWSEIELSIPIIIKQAWFKSTWFFVLLLFILSLFIYGLTRFYYQLKLKKKEEIDQLRTKISIDLHDDVGSILTGLSMQSELLELKASAADKIMLHRMSTLSKSAMLRMRDAVWAMDSRKNNWKSLMDRMNEFAAETLELKDIGYQIKCNIPQRNKSLNNVLRQNLYLIYKEAITNIIKHSDATSVTIDLKVNNGQLDMQIKDNGSTPIQKFSTSGLGLSNMKHRANEINGSIEITYTNGFTILLKTKVTA